MSDLLATKLRPPAAPTARVPRPHLVRRMDEGLAAGRPLTLVSAPAGFGKTTCVAEWVEGLDRPVAWLSLDAADDDPVRFFTYFVAALQQVDEGLGQEIAGRLFISLNTVRSHVKSTYGKLDVNNRTQAIERARQVDIL